jgi:hypothetical protein
MNLLEKPNYLALWPQWLDLPVRAEVIKDHWDPTIPGFLDPHTLEEYPEDFGLGPGVVVEMPNGAVYTLQYRNPLYGHPDDISYEGNWDHYIKGDKFLFEHIRDSLERALHLITIQKYKDAALKDQEVVND